MLIAQQRVVSLWKMMSELGGCLHAITNIVLMHGQVEEALNAPNKPDTIVFNKRNNEATQQDLAELQRVASELRMDALLHYVNYCIELLSRGLIGHDGELLLARNNAERLQSCLESIRTSFLVQMNSKLVLVLGTGHAEFLQSSEPPFGRAVDDAFPKAASDISEAAICLAFQRPTATVFHLMRAMEVAVECLSIAIGRDVQGRAWGIMLSAISDEIKIMPDPKERDRWSSVISLLYHVKQAWRNSTMHPKTTYTEAEAEAVFVAVRSFMIALVPMLSVE